MKPGSTIALFAIALSLSATSSPAVEPPTSLTAKPIPNQLGLALNEYAFAWEAKARQSYQILVASDEAKLAADVGDLWDSGRRFRGGSAQPIPYRGEAIPGGANLWWKVRVWEFGGEVSPWSEPATIAVPEHLSREKAVPYPTTTNDQIEFVDGRIGKAAHLVHGSRIEVADYPGLHSEAGTTIAAWIKPEQVKNEWQCIYRKESGKPRRLLAIGQEGPFWGLWCGFGIGGSYVEFGAPVDAEELADGEWHHVAASFDGEVMRLYVDGEKIGEQERVGKLDRGDASPAFIGSYMGTGERYVGGIDDLRIYSKGLSGEAISKLAKGEAEVEEDAVAGRWTFEGNVENSVTYTPETTQNRIVLLGGTLVADMERHGFFETAVTARWPQHDITFRNLGWPADDVFGTARSEFGSAQNTRSWKPPGAEAGFGFNELMRQVREAKPTTLMVAYGAETAFMEEGEQRIDWEEGYRRLLDELEKLGANLILWTPVAHVNHGPVLPDAKANNERLRRTADFVLKIGKQRGHQTVDNTGRLFGGWGAKAPINPAYTNGVRLNEFGHRYLAHFLSEDLGVGLGDYTLYYAEGNGRKWVTSADGKTHTSVLVPGDDPSWMTAYAGTATHQEATKRGFRLDARLDQLPAVTGGGMVRSPWRRDDLGDGPPFTVRIDGEGDVGQLRGGLFTISGGPVQRQAEELRQKIIEKNRFHRYKLRPINKAYIFLFRRHEMGHLAYELEDFDELIAGHERAISHLRKPRTHSYAIERVEPWEPPRNYPDHEVPKDIPAPDTEAELAALSVAEGFEVNLFAKDPMIANPINLNWDNRGRAWVSTSSTYPHIKPGREPDDRIVILEDADGDGVADKHTVFADGLTVPHSVMPVAGGAYVCSSTELLFLADIDGDDVSESRRVIYSGFGNADVHHMIHGLRWAPWGDLHFTQSIYINSFVDTPRGPRRMNGSGIWRFRPETERLEALAVGMVNPWGFAFDRWGQSFATDGAGGSGPHYVFPGAAFPSAVGAHRVLNGLIPGKPKNTAAEFVSGRHMPDRWQGSLLANDFRANRTVRYELQPGGSGYTAKEVETVLHSTHRSFRPVDIKMGPDGAVYVVDWYNPIIDHGEVDFHHPLRDRSHGRIWRVTAKDRPLVERPQIDGAALEDLLELLKSPEQYTRSQAIRELASRPCQGMIEPILAWVEALDPADPEFENHRVEALWLLMSHRVGSPDLVEAISRSTSPQARAAAVRAVANWGSLMIKPLDKLGILGRAVSDEHPQVRLEAINAARRLGTLEGANLALRALDHPTDNNIRFALELTVRELRELWLPALERGEQVFGGDPSHLNYALREVDDPRAVGRLLNIVREGELEGEELRNAVRTVAALGESGHLDALLELAPTLLPDIAEGARFNAARPKNPATLIRQLRGEHGAAAAELCGRWQVREATGPLAEMLRAQPSAATARSLAMLGEFETLREINSPQAIAAWAGAQPREALPAALAKFSEPVIAAYLEHAEGPSVLAAGLAKVRIREDLAIAGTRLAHASGRDVAPLVAALAKAGDLKPLGLDLTPEDRRSLLADATKKGDADRGREIYLRAGLLCSNCHTIDGEGGQLGPDLSTVGSYMTPESLLESLLNPNTDIKQGYETVVATLEDGRVVTGLLQRKTRDAHLIRDPSGEVVQVPNSDIAKFDSSPVSLMPPGLTTSLRHDELVDLMRYLTTLGKRAP